MEHVPLWQEGRASGTARVSSTAKAVLLNDTRNDRHHGCMTVFETIVRLCRENGIELIGTAPAHHDWRANPSIRRAMEGADLIVVNGEGTIHHDRPAGEWLLAAGRHAQLLGKKAVLINMTWHENGARYVELASHFDLVSVRESRSAEELALAGIFPRIVPDLALYRQAPRGLSRDGTGYTDCVVAPAALALYRQMAKLRAKPISLLYGRQTPSDFMISLRRFLPGWTAFNPHAAANALRGAFTDFRSQLTDRDALLAWVASRRLIVTGRFHMLIFALAARTPVLTVRSNTHKIESTLADAGLAPWRCVDAASIDATVVERASFWDDDEERQLEAFIADGREKMRQLFADVRALL
jgi:polysaccharide pyruvyl transferase WcaK-like protein